MDLTCSYGNTHKLQPAQPQSWKNILRQKSWGIALYGKMKTCIFVWHYYQSFIYLDYREVFKYLDIAALPSVSDELVRVVLADTEVGVPSETMRCIRCTDVPVKAVVCCADCKKRFCHQHSEVCATKIWDQSAQEIHFHDDEQIRTRPWKHNSAVYTESLA